VGLHVHEAPRLGKTAEGSLEAGNAVTVEPGVYLPGEFGVRIEDLVIVSDGEPEILTGFPKELVEVG
jgi:Xaa-Pro aminopeptidase